MFEVEIRNYESLGHVKFSVDGFTALIGRNSRGKSAVLRAIDAALTNRQGTKFIRWGEKFCEVHIKTEGLDLLWHKENGNNFYEVNNEKYLKVGRETPPKAIIEAGFGVVKLGEQKLNLNYARQFFPLFLVDRQDTKGADLIASVYGLDRLYKASDLCSKEHRTVNDTLKIRQKDLDIVEEDLKHYEGLDEILKSVASLKSQKEALEAHEADVLKLKDWYQKLITLIVASKRLRDVSEVVVPSDLQVADKAKEYDRLTKYQRAVELLRGDLKKLEKTDELKIPETPSVVEKATQLDKLRGTYTQVVTLVKAVKKLKTVQDVIIPDVSFDTEEVTKLRQSFKSILAGKHEVLDVKKQRDEADTELATVEEKLSTYSRCPACGAELEGKE